MGIRHLMSAAAAVATIATVLSTSAADTLTPKQALVQGRSTTAPVRAEPRVGRLIVKMREAAPAGATGQAARIAHVQRLQAETGVGMQHMRELAGGASLVRLQQGMTLSQARAAAARVARDPSVEYAEPDIMMKKLAVPNETRFTEWQWNLFAPSTTYNGNLISTNAPKSAPATGGADLPRAWDITTGSGAVIVAVIDTGIVNHPDLNGISTPAPYTPAGRFVAGYDFISSDAQSPGLPLNFVANDGDGRDPDPTDPGDWVTAAEQAAHTECDDPNVPNSQDIPSSWHGTHMAGILAAASNNSLGIAGVAWNVRIQPIRALGKCGGALSDIAEAIRWAAGLPVAGIPNNATPAKVVNLSLGGGDCTDNLQYMQDAVTAATAAGSVVVAATGNESNTSVIAPANCTGAIGVTAHTINGENADYANVGTGTTISAPGGGTPTQLGAGLATDDTNWTGYYVWSTLLFADRDPNSVDASGQSGPAYAGFTGTSAATPHVAGTVALIKSVLPSATAAQVRSFLQSTARPYPAGSVCTTGGALAGMCGAGLLDSGAALAAAVAIAPPSVVVPPQNVNVFEGQAASLSVVAVGANPLSYQWKLNGTNIAGATASTYTTAALSLADSGKRYSVTVSNSLGTVTTPEATVTVSTPPPPQSGGGGGALPLGQLLLLAALLLAARIQRRI